MKDPNSFDPSNRGMRDSPLNWFCRIFGHVKGWGNGYGQVAWGFGGNKWSMDGKNAFARFVRAKPTVVGTPFSRKFASRKFSGARDWTRPPRVFAVTAKTPGAAASLSTASCCAAHALGRFATHRGSLFGFESVLAYRQTMCV